ncbi:DUF4255 domain-containing protein [Streptomyces celluloflavus]|uniref:DUF4255 domain-containing protein n=1 Tax=Streptomyces celluloflavus TaxID=58344 RepID=A0ABW7RDK6_9ACTN
MSNALAVATVTQALALLIEHNLHPEIDMAVSVETRKPPSDPPTDPTITVFLYQVTHNSSMGNSDLVTRASDGTLLKRSAAAVDLNFLISAYGEETELVGQRLIGSVVRTLHEIPVLPEDLIEEAARRPYLAGSDLAESPQKVRFTPTQMDVDETSKLWGMLNNTPYALSVVYQASLVLLDGHQKPVPARPVRRPEVTVVAEVAPVIPLVGGAEGAVGAVAAASADGSAGAEASAGTDGSAGTDAPAGAVKRGAKRTVKKVAAGGEPAASGAASEGSGARSRPRPRTRTRKAVGADEAGGSRGSGGSDGSRGSGGSGGSRGSDSSRGSGSSGGSADPGRTDDGKER